MLISLKILSVPNKSDFKLLRYLPKQIWNFDSTEDIIVKTLKDIPLVTTYRNNGSVAITDPRDQSMATAIEIVSQLMHKEAPVYLSCCFTREIGLAERLRADHALLLENALPLPTLKILTAVHAHALRVATL